MGRKQLLRAARKALEENGRQEDAVGIRHETATFRRLNRAVADAEKAVPWWRDDAREIPDRFRYRNTEG